jgi:plasmid stabilization system protein ParE
MAEIRWTPQAAEDLEAIADFIAVDSLHYAQLLVIDIW